jgi:prevent-host-death family protein
VVTFMRQVNIHEAKSTLSRLVEAVLAGEDVVLARAGKPAVRLVPYKDSGGLQLGLHRGFFGTVPADFDAPLPPDELAPWDQGPVMPG